MTTPATPWSESASQQPAICHPVRVTTETDRPTWRKSSGCSNGTCVEVARDGGTYLVRDSKNLAVEPLRLSGADWTGFVDAIESGDFGF